MVSLGGSDIASLTLRSPEVASILKFGSDGNYLAYLIDETIVIPAHYSLSHTFNKWLCIYDDDSCVRKFTGEEIKIFQAGMFGCIIQVVKKDEEKKVHRKI